MLTTLRCLPKLFHTPRYSCARFSCRPSTSFIFLNNRPTMATLSAASKKHKVTIVGSGNW